MFTLKAMQECDCKVCKHLLAAVRKAKARGDELSMDTGGHGWRLCRKYKGHWYGIDCGCFSHRKRIHRVKNYEERKEQASEDI